MRPSQSRRIVWILPIAFLVFGLLWMRSERQGLYNNRSDLRAALREHDQAWGERIAGPELSRLDMYMLVRQFGGDCITGEPEWESVHLDQPLNNLVRRPGITIECHFDVRGRAPALLRAYRWTTTLLPVSPDRVRLLRSARSMDTLI